MTSGSPNPPSSPQRFDAAQRQPLAKNDLNIGDESRWISTAPNEISSFRQTRSSALGSSRSDANTASGFLMRSSTSLRDAVARSADTFAYSTKTKLTQLIKWLDSPTGRGVLKCTMAYTLASLATFLSPLSAFLGKPDGKHVVATITVYFHPARSTGSMIEAVIVVIISIIYAEVVSLLSMVTSVLVGSGLGMVTLAHVLVVVVFIGVAFGLMGWIKQKMNNILVNVGTTLASLAMITVLTKETAVVDNVFSNQKIVQVLKILIMGATSTTAVNLLVWRVDSRSLLRDSMTKASVSLGRMLASLSGSLLKGEEDDAASGEYSAAKSSYMATYPQMMKNLRETKFEQYFLGRERVYVLQRSTVKALETLAQSIGGLRSASKTLLSLLKEKNKDTPRLHRFYTFSSFGDPEANSLNSLRLLDENRSPSPLAQIRPPTPMADAIHTPAALFELFVEYVGPALEALSESLSQVLREPPFGPAPSYHINLSDESRHLLGEALGNFQVARLDALQEMYSIIEAKKSTRNRTQADLEEVAAACGHFSFSLQSFAEELQKYLDVLDDLKYATDHTKRSWRWMLWWKKPEPYNRGPGTDAFVALPEAESLMKPIRKRDVPRGIPDSLIQRRDTYNWQASPDAGKIIAMLSQSVLRLARKLARDEVLFGLKVGIGAALWGMLAFIEETRDFYARYRGEWGLLSFMIVCSMTVGATNTVGYARFLGTLIGAVFSLVNWSVSGGNAVVLLILGWFVSFYSFYLKVGKGKIALGRTIMLAYNVSALYAYSLSQKVDDDDDDEGGVHPIMMKIVKHRLISVNAGILWGMIVCRFIWPISARKKFKEGVSMLYLQMGLIWRRGPLAILLRSDSSESYLRSGEQEAMQRYAGRLESLRQSASSEFELRGPFPFEVYGRVMRSTNRILDAFYAMSLITQRKGRLTAGERALLEYTASERAMLCNRICHVFQVLASSVMLEYPLTDAIPSVYTTRDRLLSKIFQFHKAHSPSNPITPIEGPGEQLIEGESSNSDTAVTNQQLDLIVEEKDYALLYAYALVTGQIATELRVAEKEIEGLFGVLNEQSPLLQ